MARKSHPGMGSTKLNGQLALPLIKACSNNTIGFKGEQEGGQRARVTRKGCAGGKNCCWVPIHTSSTERADRDGEGTGIICRRDLIYISPRGGPEPRERLGLWLGEIAATGPGAPRKSVLNLEGTRLALILGIAGAAARKTALFTSEETGSGDTG